MSRGCFNITANTSNLDILQDRTLNISSNMQMPQLNIISTPCCQNCSTTNIPPQGRFFTSLDNIRSVDLLSPHQYHTGNENHEMGIRLEGLQSQDIFINSNGQILSPQGKLINYPKNFFMISPKQENIQNQQDSQMNPNRRETSLFHSNENTERILIGSASKVQINGGIYSPMHNSVGPCTETDRSNNFMIQPDAARTDGFRAMNPQKGGDACKKKGDN